MNDVESLCHALAQPVRIRRFGWTGQALRHDDLILHDVLSSSSVSAKWRGHHRTLAADVADDVRRVCTFANQDVSLPLKTDDFNNAYACSTFVLQAGDLGCFKCSTCAKSFVSELLKSRTENTSTDALSPPGRLWDNWNWNMASRFHI